MHIDLTPFGFTPTESLAYGALVEHGASSGYKLGKALTLARANAYQALHGLLAKGAAVVVAEGPPQVIRAVSPKALLTMVSQRTAERLDRLEQQVYEHSAVGADVVVAVRGRRAFEQVVMQMAVRPVGPVTAVAPSDILATLAPIWRKRLADRSPTAIWAVGEPDSSLAIRLNGQIPAAAATALFGASVALVTTPAAAVAARVAGTSLDGYWSSHPVICGLTASAIAHLVGPPTP